MTRQNAILTFTNTLFYPLAPQTDEVKIEDIAHALSQMCRANGHFKTFYSVAQHSINCAQEAKIRGLSGSIQLAQQHMNNVVAGSNSYKCVGIDSCTKTGKYQGWAAFWQDSCGNYGFSDYRNITDLMAEHHDADCLLIDIPVGLPENNQDESARPDRELRSRLKGKSSSVFNTPCRQAVYCLDKQDAKALNIQFLNKSLSEQSLCFSPKVREVDQFLFDNPQFIGRLRESHPEYGFAVLNHGQPLISKKSESIGLNERKVVLSQHLIYTENALNEIIAKYPKALIDDFVDAMVLAVIGNIGMQNGFETIPEQPKKDNRGLPMEIVYGRVK